jgi:hypothetical protein
MGKHLALVLAWSQDKTLSAILVVDLGSLSIEEMLQVKSGPDSYRLIIKQF